MANDRTTRDEPISGWAVGGITFAACILILIGAFQVIGGLVAIIDDEFYVVTSQLHLRPRHHRMGLDPPACSVYYSSPLALACLPARLGQE